MKIFKHKRGINDISIIAIITMIFFLTAIAIPFVNAEFDQNIATFNTDTVEQDIKNEAESESKISGFDILLTVTKLALFDWSDSLGLPFWLDLLYTVLAVTFLLVIARNIWIGGGA